MNADPCFYLVALPAVLLLGIGKSGFGAGLGSLAVRIAHHIQLMRFHRMVCLSMLLTSTKLLWDAFH